MRVLTKTEENEEMPILAHKIQVLLDDAQYAALLALAKAEGKSVSAFLREAVVERLLADVRRMARQKAFEEIAAMELPVGDWPDMEGEIEQAHGAARKRP
jgi:hypothetical protein